jgi:hypothetical protein
MLTEFDQTTIANMTASDYICKKIPKERDSNELRKRIAEELMQSACLGKRSVVDLQAPGLKLAQRTVCPNDFRWFGVFNWRPRAKR